MHAKMLISSLFRNLFKQKIYIRYGIVISFYDIITVIYIITKYLTITYIIYVIDVNIWSEQMNVKT